MSDTTSPTQAPLVTETLAEAARRTHCHPRTLRRRIASGDLTAWRFGPRMIRVDPAEVDALLRPIPNATTAA